MALKACGLHLQIALYTDSSLWYYKYLKANLKKIMQFWYTQDKKDQTLLLQQSWKLNKLISDI